MLLNVKNVPSFIQEIESCGPRSIESCIVVWRQAQNRVWSTKSPFGRGDPIIQKDAYEGSCCASGEH